jgi:hypothetical protein
MSNRVSLSLGADKKHNVNYLPRETHLESYTPKPFTAPVELSTPCICICGVCFELNKVINLLADEYFKCSMFRPINCGQLKKIVQIMKFSGNSNLLTKMEITFFGYI